MRHFLSRLRAQIERHPEQQVLVDHNGTISYTYSTLALQMARIDAMLTSIGIQQGDKIALCGRNCSNWAATFMAVLARRSVAVTILPDFTTEGICELVLHSDAKAFFVGSSVWKAFQEDAHLLQAIQAVPVIIGIDDFSVVSTNGTLNINTQALNDCLQLSADKFDLKAWFSTWPEETCDELCLINYTSGTTSSPKGVMLSSLSLSANFEQALCLIKEVPEGKHVVSILPMAHMYGLELEVLAQLAVGACVHILTKAPTPSMLVQALQTVKPYVLLCVPLVIEKVFRQKVIPMLTKPHMRFLLAIPGVNRIVKAKVRQKVIDALGGNLTEGLVIGGAALSQEVEKWMHKLNIPYIVGYGMTECGPLIAASQVGTFACYSCGKQVKGMDIRIDSEDPHKIDGEILVKGTNVMLGYYKNEEATQAAFTKDGWLRTGDLGILTHDGDLLIRGRSKNMLLGPSGQNIYPEELEDRVNSIPGVVESIVLERDGHLVALIYPDAFYQRRLGKEKVESLINRRLTQINHHLPKYSQIKSFEFVEKEFEKTPKKSIKRFLYQ